LAAVVAVDGRFKACAQYSPLVLEPYNMRVTREEMKRALYGLLCGTQPSEVDRIWGATA